MIRAVRQRAGTLGRDPGLAAPARGQAVLPGGKAAPPSDPHDVVSRRAEIPVQIDSPVVIPAQARYRSALPWERRQVVIAVSIDLLAFAIAATAAFALPLRQGVTINAWRYSAVAAGMAVLWIASIWLSRAYEPRFLGIGSEEFKRTFNAAARLIATIGTISYATDASISRRHVVIAFPAALALALLGRYAARRRLGRLRRSGRCLYRVIVAGSASGVSDLIRNMAAARQAGMHVVGCCLDQRGPNRPESIDGIPVLGDLDSIPRVLAVVGATAVAVTATEHMSSNALQHLAWQIEGNAIDLLVAPALTDIAGPRIHIRPVAGLPLLHVEEPELSGARRLLKGLFDRLLALVAIIIMLPVLAAIAVAIRLTSPGGAIFRQPRCGQDGRLFTIYKFRTMHVDAETRLESLLELNDHSEGVLFKMRKDPRVTPLGRILRRYSLDELPQLVNILFGHMSLVGPRPPLPDEVARYASDVRRRLLVKPGLTGLWQISGRSDLSWEESVRLDLHYIENWSLSLDFMIVWRTMFAVARGSGAY